MSEIKVQDPSKILEETQTVYSPGYSRIIRNEEYYDWYDVRPFGLAVWPHIFARRLRKGDWSIERRRYSGFAVEMVLSGEIIYETENEKFSVGPGEIFVTHTLESVTLHNGNCRSSRQLQLIYSDTFSRQVSEALSLKEIHKLSGDLQEIRRLMEHCGMLMQRRAPGDDAENSLIGYKVMLALAARKAEQDIERGYPPLLTHAVRLIHNSSGVISISDLARKLGVSRSTLDRLFNNYIHTSPQDFRSKVRIENARRLIRENSLSFKEIADRLGFSTPAYLSSAFRSATGETLSDYRNRRRNAPEES